MIPWTASVRQASVSFTISRSLCKLTSIESLMPANHLIPCCLLLFLPTIFPRIKVFSSDLTLCNRWPKCWNFSVSTSPSNQYSALISFRIDLFDLLVFCMEMFIVASYLPQIEIEWDVLFIVKGLKNTCSTFIPWTPTQQWKEWTMIHNNKDGSQICFAK